MPARTRPMPSRRACLALAAAVASLALLAGCEPSYLSEPRDPQRSTARVEGGVLRVGIVHDPPFVDARGDGPPRGPEARMVQALAQSLDARVAWIDGGADGLLEDLEHFRLELVIGGLSAQSPWRKRVALTLPYRVRDAHGRLVERVAAVPPGENRWQMRVERFQRSPTAQAILRGPPPEPAR